MAKEQVSSILRALRILECFMDRETEWTLKELVEYLDLPTTTVFRQVSTLTERQYLIQDPVRKSYRPGPRLLLLSSAILGPVGTMLFHMTNNATGSGMGTAGLVGPLMTWQVMTQTESGTIVLLKILLIQFLLPAVLTLLISEFMRKKKWIRPGDMKLEL